MAAILKSEIIDEIRRVFGAGRFHCIRLQDADVLFRIEIGVDGWICVIGHPGCGAYEWVARRSRPCDAGAALRECAENYRFSDKGYGSAVGALRDGLNALEED
jgi:hypothetical protein